MRRLQDGGHNASCAGRSPVTRPELCAVSKTAVTMALSVGDGSRIVPGIMRRLQDGGHPGGHRHPRPEVPPGIRRRLQDGGHVWVLAGSSPRRTSRNYAPSPRRRSHPPVCRCRSPSSRPRNYAPSPRRRSRIWRTFRGVRWVPRNYAPSPRRRSPELPRTVHERDVQPGIMRRLQDGGHAPLEEPRDGVPNPELCAVSKTAVTRSDPGAREDVVSRNYAPSPRRRSHRGFGDVAYQLLIPELCAVSKTAVTVEIMNAPPALPAPGIMRRLQDGGHPPPPSSRTGGDTTPELCAVSKTAVTPLLR